MTIRFYFFSRFVNSLFLYACEAVAMSVLYSLLKISHSDFFIFYFMFTVCCVYCSVSIVCSFCLSCPYKDSHIFLFVTKYFCALAGFRTFEIYDRFLQFLFSLGHISKYGFVKSFYLLS